MTNAELENDAKARPADVLREAERILAASSTGADRADRLRILGIAARIDRDLPRSRAYLDEALAMARHADADVLGRVLVTSAANCVYEGDNDAALSCLAEAEPLVGGIERALLHSHRAVILHRMDRVDEALADYRLAISGFRGSDDPTWEADARMNRAILYADAGRVTEAQRDVERALDAYRSVDSPSGIADATHNLGFVAVRQGDIPAALGHLDDAQQAYRAADLPHAAIPPARCEALMAAGLFQRAFDEALDAATEYKNAGSAIDEAQALLLATRAANLSGNARRAFDIGHRCASMFDEQSRTGWSAAARFETLLARFTMGGDDLTSITKAAEVAEQLGAARFRSLSGRAHLLAARFANRVGQGAQCEQHLQQAWSVLRDGPLEYRIEYWATCAEHRRSVGNERGAATAIAAGFRCFARHQDSFAALDLRSHVSEHVRALADLALERAWQSRRPVAVANAIEMARSRALLMHDTRRPADPTLDELLARLRAASAKVDRGNNGQGASVSDVGDVRTAQRRIEEYTARRSSATRAERALGSEHTEHQMVQLGVVGNDLVGVVRLRGRRRLVALGSMDELRLAANSLQHDLDLAATGQLDGRPSSVHRLDDLLRGVLGRLDSSLPVVIGPPPELFDLAWAALPSLQDVAFEVTPSIGMWVEARSRPRRHPDRVGIVVGPRLQHAQPEVDAVRMHWAHHDAPEAPNVDRVIATLEGADVAHIVAHGSFESDNPLFSALEFADGNLVFHDFQRINDFPAVLFLSACSGALHVARGREIVGLGAGLLALGAKSVISASGFVPDSKLTAGVADLVHQGLASGSSPAAALRRARSVGNPEHRTVASLFTAYGGW